MKKFNFAFFSHMFSRRYIASCLAIVAISLIFACSTALYIPTQNQATSNANLNDLKDGRSAYINKCGGCHTLFVPEKYSANEWNSWVDKMEVKAKITASEKEKILKYLTKGK